MAIVLVWRMLFENRIEKKGRHGRRFFIFVIKDLITKVGGVFSCFSGCYDVERCFSIRIFFTWWRLWQEHESLILAQNERWRQA